MRTFYNYSSSRQPSFREPRPADSPCSSCLTFLTHICRKSPPVSRWVPSRFQERLWMAQLARIVSCSSQRACSSYRQHSQQQSYQRDCVQLQLTLSEAVTSSQADNIHLSVSETGCTTAVTVRCWRCSPVLLTSSSRTRLRPIQSHSLSPYPTCPSFSLSHPLIFTLFTSP